MAFFVILFAQHLNTLADTCQRLFLAQNFHDLGSSGRGHLLAGNRGTDGPNNETGLHALISYILRQGGVQSVVGEVLLRLQKRQHILQQCQRILRVGLHFLVGVH